MVRATHATSRRARIVLAVLLLALASGCEVSPLPEPPNLGSQSLTAGPCGTNCDGDVALVQGGPGSVSPPEGIVRLVNIDSVVAPREFPVAGDGSFSAQIAGGSGNELRVQIVSGDLRSRPAHIVVPVENGSASPRVPPLACFSLDVPTDLGFGDVALGSETTRMLELRNECSEAVTVAGVALRVPTPSFVVMSPSLPLVVPANDTVAIEIQFTPEREGPIEELLLIQTSAPIGDRRAVSLFGRGEAF